MSIGRRRAPYASQLRRLVVAVHTRIATPPAISHEPVITITSHPDKCAAPATIRSAPKLSIDRAAMTSQNTGAAMIRIIKHTDELAWDADYRTGRPELHGDRDDRKRAEQAAILRDAHAKPGGKPRPRKTRR